MTERACHDCRWFHRLQHGAVGICMMEWRDLEWNDAVPLKMRDNSCDKFKMRGDGELARESK